MLIKRIQSAVLIVVVLLALVWWLPVYSPSLPLVIALLLGWGGVEFYALLRAAGIPSQAGPGVAAVALLVLVTWFAPLFAPWLSGPPGYALLVIALCTATLLSSKRERPVESLAGTLLGFAYVGLLGNYLTRLILFPGWDALRDGRLLVLYLVIVVKISDIAAFAVGSRWGRHKLFPRISPAKTWEGAGAGLIAGCLAALLWWALAGGRVGDADLRWTQALLLGFLLPAAGIFSDLTESMVKRASGAKDSGRAFQGMGGLLDVVDSLFFSAPLFYALMRWFTLRG